MRGWTGAHVVVVHCLLGCSSEAHNLEDWTDALSALSRSPGVIYGPGFRGVPPSGEYMRLSLHAIPTEKACELYQTGWDTGEEQYILRITTDGMSSGAYTVVEKLEDKAIDVEPQAYARLIRTANGVKTQSLWAAGGWLHVQGIARSVEEWHAGSSAAIHLHLDFPRDPIAGSECASGGDKQGRWQGQCTCTLASGKISTCPMQSLSEDCCTSPSPEIPFDAELLATPCAAMCIFTDPSLAMYCQELR